MRQALAAALLLTATAGCASHDRADGPPDAGAGTCDVARAAGLMGQQASPAGIEGARRAARARTVRVIRPGRMVTMDYRADRLNVELTADGRVRRLRCG